MTRVLQGRGEDEVPWWQRRSFVHAAATSTTMGHVNHEPAARHPANQLK